MSWSITSGLVINFVVPGLGDVISIMLRLAVKSFHPQNRAVYSYYVKTCHKLCYHKIGVIWSIMLGLVENAVITGLVNITRIILILV